MGSILKVGYPANGTAKLKCEQSKPANLVVIDLLRVEGVEVSI